VRIKDLANGAQYLRLWCLSSSSTNECVKKGPSSTVTCPKVMPRGWSPDNTDMMNVQKQSCLVLIAWLVSWALKSIWASIQVHITTLKPAQSDGWGNVNTFESGNWHVNGRMEPGTVLAGLDEWYSQKFSERPRRPLNQCVRTSLAAWLGQQTSTLFVFCWYCCPCCNSPNTSAMA
jgi:hypothetical protein